MSDKVSHLPDLPDGKASRTRGLDLIDRVFVATGGPASFVSDLLKKRERINVLEIGFGYACALLELAWKFRHQSVTFFGVDVEDKPELNTHEGISDIVSEFDLFPPEEIASINRPKLYFYDATRLYFDDDSIDFIFSAVTIRFIEDKVAFLQEVARVLSPGGIALLHIGESHWNYPYSTRCDDKILTPYCSRLVL